MDTKLELENENSTHIREELTFERNKDGSILVTAVIDDNTGYGWRDPEAFELTEYTLSKEQVAQVIEFLSQS